MRSRLCSGDEPIHEEVHVDEGLPQALVVVDVERQRLHLARGQPRGDPRETLLVDVRQHHPGHHRVCAERSRDDLSDRAHAELKDPHG
jgi:hypothetical protein